MKNIFLVLAGALSIIFTSCVQKFYPEKPVTGQYDAPPPPPESIVEIPVSVDVKGMSEYLNKQIPKVLYEGSESGTEVAEFEQGILYVSKEYKWTADFEVVKNGKVEFDVLKDGTFRFKIPLKVNCDGCASVWLGTTIRKCGSSSPEIDLIVTSKVSLNPDWSLKSKSTIAYDLKEAEIEIPFYLAGFPAFVYRMDIKEDLQEPMEKELRSYAKDLDKMIAEEFARLNVKKMVSEYWIDAQKPQKVSENPDIWMTIEAKSIHMGQFSLQKSKLILPLGLGAIVHIGTTPKEITPTALPPVSEVTNPGKLSLYVPVTVDYKSLAKIANQQVKDSTFTSGKHSVTIKDVQISGTAKALVVNVAIKAKSGKLFKRVEGNVQLMAVPAYNVKTRTVFLKHFEISTETNKTLLDKNLSWLAEKIFYEKIIKMAKYDIGPELDKQKAEANKQLKNIEYDMIKINGAIDNIELDGIFMQPEGVTFYFKASGTVESEINPK